MPDSPHILMLFLDGVGIGLKDKKENPFFAAQLEIISDLMGGDIIHLRDAYRSNKVLSLVPLNTTLRVPGLPQSGTGQAALMTGTNAPKIIGKHFGPYLYSTLRPLVAEQNIFRILQTRGKKVYYANAFPQQYFDYIHTKKSRMAAIAYSWMSSGHDLNDATKLKAGRAISADITNEHWDKLGYPDVPVISPENAGKQLVELTKEFDFVLYEYYMTDRAGHDQSMEEAVQVLHMLDRLFRGILDALDYEHMLLIVTSDHGNIEDLSTKTHTRNPVPLLAFGRCHNEATARATNLTHVIRGITKILQ